MADHADEGDNNDNVMFVYMGGLVPWHLRVNAHVHKSVKVITREAFKNCGRLVSIELHDGVEIIEWLGFYHCTSLIRLKLPGVRVIGEDAFQNCTALEDVEFGNKGIRSHLSKEFKLPKVSNIGRYAFYGCDQLMEAELSEDLERVKLEAFGECPLLRRIVIPLKGNLLSDGLFDECGNLSQVDLVGEIHKTIASLLLERWRNEMK
jgi:hypothetical protein